MAATNNPKQPGFPDRYFYDRKFLLAFQQAPDCAKKPACLPNLDIVLDTAHQPTRPVVPGKTYVRIDLKNIGYLFLFGGDLIFLPLTFVVVLLIY